MSLVFVIGAAGQIGRHLVTRLCTKGRKVRALHRQPAQAGLLAAAGATPVAGDLQALDADTLAEAMRGCDVLVFTAGAGGQGGAERTRAIDGDGLELTVAAAQAAGVRRLLLVSAFPEAGRGKALADTFEVYMAVKKAADVHLAQSGLDWVILRPGTLVDTAGTGRISAGPAIAYGQVPREDVAATLVAQVERPAVRRVIIELTTGSLPIAEALDYLEPDAAA
ncbi:MAG: putative sugar epimerase YhfK [Stenotrophomonas maltophilia]|nr:MAG: putative sugar epimerase YhfK [Stenotrophomonas maltophilia]